MQERYCSCLDNHATLHELYPCKHTGTGAMTGCKVRPAAAWTMELLCLSSLPPPPPNPQQLQTAESLMALHNLFQQCTHLYCFSLSLQMALFPRTGVRDPSKSRALS